jgi:alpha-glucosidase
MDLSDCGIYVKNNSIMPLAPLNNTLDKEKVDTLIIKIFGDEALYELYDDDGISLDYQKGIYNLYKINYTNNKLVFETIYKKYKATYKTIQIEKGDVVKTIPFEYSFELMI